MVVEEGSIALAGDGGDGGDGGGGGVSSTWISEGDLAGRRFLGVGM